MAKYLGVDYGDSRVGVSISDASGSIAFKYGVIDAKKGRAAVVKELCRIVIENSIAVCVLGYPVEASGNKGKRVVVTEKLARELAQYVSEQGYEDFKVEFYDERFTTVAANKAMAFMGVAQSKKGISDEIAAMMILQDYIERNKQ